MRSRRFASFGLSKRRQTTVCLLVIFVAGLSVRGADSLIFPFFVNGYPAIPQGQLQGEGWQTVFLVSNPNPIEVDLNVDVFDSQGSRVDTKTLLSPAPPIRIEPLGSKRIIFDVRLPASGDTLLLGWVRITATEQVTASEVLNRLIVRATLTPPVFSWLEKIEVPPAVKGLTSLFFVENSSGTGIALLNPNEQGPARGKVILRDSTGAVWKERNIELEAGKPRIQMLAELFELPADTGVGGGSVSIDFEAGKVPVVVTVIRTDGSFLIPAYVSTLGQ